MNTPEKNRPKSETFHPTSYAAIIAMEELEDWISNDLERLEQEFDSFKTFNSIRNSIGRSANKV